MQCPSIAQLEERILGGEPDRAGSDLARHLAECAQCAEAARDIRENQAFMASLTDALGAEAQLRRPNAVGAGGSSPAGDSGPGDGAEGAAPIDGDALPGYRLVREIARGGQGIVYEAVQLLTKRRVAIKIIQPDGRSSLRRLEVEAELAASLRHPSIVSVYQILPLPDGRCALAMEYVEGVTLDRWIEKIDGEAPSTRAGQLEVVRTKLRLVLDMCRAIHHTHVNGVIHRDLKPSNVLVTGDGSVRIVDFGIARRITHANGITRAGGFAGTLAYASPEQVSGSVGAVDARTDVYSLGLILYEILASKRPYDTEGSLSDAIGNITRTPPEALRLLHPGAQPAGGELRAIVGKALEKRPDHRYQSAAAMGSDIENWLQGRPVSAHGQSTLYLVRKLAARHRVSVGVIACIAGLLIALVISMAWSSAKLAQRRTQLSDALASSTIERGRLMGMVGQNSRAEELIWPILIDARADLADPDLCFNAPSGVAQAAWALHELYSRGPSLMHTRLDPGARAIRFEADGTRVRVIYLTGAQVVISIPDGAVVSRTPPLGPTPFRNVRLDTARGHALLSRDGLSTILNLDSQTVRTLELGDIADAEAQDLNLDTSRLLTLSGDGTLQLLSTDPVETLRTLKDPSFINTKPKFSEDGSVVVAAAGDKILLWNARDGSDAGTVFLPESIRASMANPVMFTATLSHDRALLAAGMSSAVLLFDMSAPGLPPRVIEDAHRGFVSWIEFSTDGSIMLTYGAERNYKVWGVETGELLGQFEHGSPLRGIPMLDRSGDLVGLCDETGVVRVFESRPGMWLSRLPPAGSSVHTVRFSPDGSTIAAVSSDGVVRAWRASDRALLWTQQASDSSLEAMCFTPDGSEIAVAGRDGMIRLISAEGSSASRDFARSSPHATWLGYSPDGATLASIGSQPVISMFDAQSGRLRRTLEGHTGRVVQAQFSSDGRTLYSVGVDGYCIAWNTSDGSERFRTEKIPDATRAICVSPDGAVIVTGSDDWKIRIWDARSGRLLKTMSGARQHVFDLAFHPSGAILFSCGRDPVVQVWDVRTGREVALLDGHDGLVLGLTISQDGRTLATAGADRTVGLWDLDYYRRHLIGNANRWRSP